MIPVLPFELLHDCFAHAWSTIQDREAWGSRWDFYCAISLLGVNYKHLMDSIALRRVVIHSSRDFNIYRKLTLSFFGTDKSSNVERVDPRVARDFFKTAELHIALADWTCTGPFRYKTDYELIPNYIPTCRMVDVIIESHPSHDYFTPQYEPLFDCLALYEDSAPVVRISWTYTHIRRYVVPSRKVYGVRHLQLHNYPRCLCHKSMGSAWPGSSAAERHEYGCFSFNLPKLFPDLEHLYIDTPYILKCITTPRACTRLEIDAPPVHSFPGRGCFGTLAHWNVISAVKAGLMQFKEETGREDEEQVTERTIVVNTGAEEPDGWAQTMLVCKERNVNLERRVHDVRPVVPQREDPAW